MRSAAVLFICLVVAVTSGLGDVAKTSDAVAPTLWSQPRIQGTEAHPVAFASNTTAPQFYNWALDIYTAQSQCSTVAEGWSGDFGTCTCRGGSNFRLVEHGSLAHIGTRMQPAPPVLPSMLDFTQTFCVRN
jgi:hypothetical protein